MWYTGWQPVYYTIYASLMVSSNQHTTQSKHHLQSVPTSTHTVHTSLTVSSNQHTHTVHTSLTASSNQPAHSPHITYSHFQSAHHTVSTPHSPHITYTLQYHSPHHNISHNSTHTLNNFNSQDLIIVLLTYININYIILNEIIIIFNCYVVMMTQLNTFVPLYCCNITMWMATVAAETCW